MPDPPPDLDDLLERGYRYALSLTHDVHRAEELIQDAALAVSRRRGPWRLEYLISVIRNRHIDLHRRAARVTFRPLDVDSRVGDAPRPIDPDDELAAALAGLRAADRELLYLAAVEELSAGEIARLTGRPRGTVLSSIHRSKRKLRASLGLGSERAATR